MLAKNVARQFSSGKRRSGVRKLSVAKSGSLRQDASRAFQHLKLQDVVNGNQVQAGRIRGSWILLVLLLVWPGTGGLMRAAPATRRPNILVILADDLGYSDLGCYGGEIPTPNIDVLAREGVRFTQCYNSARCCPSRASLMTGLYPSQAGIGDFTTARPSPDRGPGYLGRLNDQCVTLAEALQPAGYVCYYVGKWHLHPETGPIKRGFDEFYGFTEGHSHDQYDADFYQRLPRGRAKEIYRKPGEFYATDVFNDYALEFIRQGQASGKPWFVFLGHSAPHFPVQAPAADVDRIEPTYRRGWDVLRAERFARMKRIGLVNGNHWKLTPRSLVPVDRPDIANGYSGRPNPAWDSLGEARQKDLARRMAVFAAMVEHVDQGVGRIVKHLRQTGDLDNTLILFLSDNGACYEWGPFGFDGVSRRGITILYSGDDLRKIGGPGTHQSYGSAWANLGNTPFRLYKHFTHEGGISTPLIVHWPKGIGSPDRWIRQPVHVMDVMPTLCEAAGAVYPATFQGRTILPEEGKSLLGLIREGKMEERGIGFEHQGARAWREGDWKIVWSKRMPHEIRWELYNLAEDRCETTDLAGQYPDRLKAMVAEWERWAKRVQVVFEKKTTAARESVPQEDAPPRIANHILVIACDVVTRSRRGVIVAQGGRERGYALHLREGKLAFDVRVNGRVTRVESAETVPASFHVSARLDRKLMTLFVDGMKVAAGPSPGLIPVQPKDGLDVGRDEQTAAGDYEPPNPLEGTISHLEVSTDPPP
jgi:arylsulfatase A-like enzyme